MAVRVISQRDGRAKTRLYQIYTSMKDRCYRVKARDYERYGAKGIRVCPEWLASFDAFRDWALQNGYADNLTLDRKEVDGPYSPENCRWATHKEQANNRSNTKYITYEGVTRTASEWAELIGASVAAVHGHYRRTGTPYSKSALRAFKKGEIR